MTVDDEASQEPGGGVGRGDDRGGTGAEAGGGAPVAVAPEGRASDEADVAEATSELGRSATRGAGAIMVGQITKLTIHLAGLLVLARLLSPEDYGLLAMVVAIVGIGEVVRDFGLSTAAIQAKTLTNAQRDALFWINALIGLVLTLVVALLAGPIARFYGEPDLTSIARVIGLTFLLNGLSTQFRASLSRALRFGRFTIADVGGHAIGLITAVALAVAGAGPWALVGQQLGQKGGVLVLSAAFSGWLPSAPKRGTEVRGFIRFGRNLMGMQLVSYLSRNVDSLVIGRRFGAGPLGVYNRAFELLMLPLNQMNAPATTIAVPVLSRLQDDRRRFDDYLIKGQAVMMHAVMGVFALSAAVADPLIPFVMGSQWGDVVGLFRILAIGGIFHAASYACYWVFLARGRTGEGFRFQLMTRPVMVVAIVAAGQVSTEAVAWTYAASLAVTWPWQLWWIGKTCDAPAGRMLRNGLRTIAAYSVAGLAAYAASRAVAPAPDLLVIAAGVLAGVAVVGAFALVWPAFRHDLANVVAAGRHFVPSKGNRRRAPAA